MFTSLCKQDSCPSSDTAIKKKWDGLNVTPTAGYQFDVSSVNESFLIAGLTANCDLLGLVEGHLAPHLAGFTSLTEADVGPDAQHLWFWYQRLPDCCLIAAPAAGQEISRWNHWSCAQFESKINFCVWSTPLCLLCDSSVMNGGWRDLLEHAVTAVPLYGRGGDPLSYTGHQVSLPREVVVCQVFNLRGDYTQGVRRSLIITDMDKKRLFSIFPK